MAIPVKQQVLHKQLQSILIEYNKQQGGEDDPASFNPTAIINEWLSTCLSALTDSLSAWGSDDYRDMSEALAKLSNEINPHP